MIRDETDELIDYLNELVKLDRVAMNALFAVRVPTLRGIAEHPTVQVLNAANAPMVGMLGILNGFCGVIDDGPKKGWGPITAIYDCGELVCFTRTVNEAVS